MMSDSFLRTFLLGIVASPEGVKVGGRRREEEGAGGAAG